MENEKRDFNKVAASWDEDPKRVKLANDLAESIAQNIPLASDMDVMDFGCGTGLLTLNLQPQVRSITGVDSSQGMLDMLRAKTENHGLTNVSSHFKNLEDGDVLDGAYHLITSAMTFHHVNDIDPLLKNFHKILHPAGYIAIADLDRDDGQFHEDSTGVFHNGFERSWLEQKFSAAGFEDVSCRTATSILKPSADGGTRAFTVFLLIGRKKG